MRSSPLSLAGYGKAAGGATVISPAVGVAANAPATILDDGWVLHNAVTQFKKVPLVGDLAQVEFPRRFTGKALLRFSCAVADITLGDGTTAHTMCLCGMRGAGTQLELLGVLGIMLGGAMPQIPLIHAARDYTQEVDGLDGFSFLGICGLNNIEGNPFAGGTTVTVTLAPICA